MPGLGPPFFGGFRAACKTMLAIKASGPVLVTGHGTKRAARAVGCISSKASVARFVVLYRRDDDKSSCQRLEKRGEEKPLSNLNSPHQPLIVAKPRPDLEYIARSWQHSSNVPSSSTSSSFVQPRFRTVSSFLPRNEKGKRRRAEVDESLEARNLFGSPSILLFLFFSFNREMSLHDDAWLREPRFGKLHPALKKLVENGQCFISQKCEIKIFLKFTCKLVHKNVTIYMLYTNLCISLLKEYYAASINGSKSICIFTLDCPIWEDIVL